jgi:hypothetical protein
MEQRIPRIKPFVNINHPAERLGKLKKNLQIMEAFCIAKALKNCNLLMALSSDACQSLLNLAINLKTVIKVK